MLTYFVYAPLRMLAFRDFRRLLCVCLSLVVVRLWRGAHVPFCTLRSSSSSFSAFAVCSLASHLFASKKQCSRRTTKHNFGCAFSHRQTAGEVLTYLLYAPRLVLVFLGFCRLLFGKTPLCKQKSSVQDVQPSTTSVVLGCAPCFAFGQRLTRDNNFATHALFSRFSAL